jgi:PilZ domain
MSDPDPFFNERRHQHRRPFQSSTLLRLPSQQLVQVRTLDIGLGGVGLVAAQHFLSAAGCELRLLLPVNFKAPTMLVVQAAINSSVYRAIDGGFKIGLHFNGLTPEQTVLIEQFIAH